MSTTHRPRRSRSDLARPRSSRPVLHTSHYDPDAFGRFSEGIARLLGTGRYLVFQTVVVTVWIIWNAVTGGAGGAFDPYPFILLTLALSLQASYAAPLILLAQNRQDERDRTTTDADRHTSERNLADTQYLARELAAIRRSLGEIPTRDYLDDQLDRLQAQLDALRSARDDEHPLPVGER